MFKFPIRATEPFTLCGAADLHHHELIRLTLRTYLVDIIGANRTTYTHSEIYTHAEKNELKWLIIENILTDGYEIGAQ